MDLVNALTIAGHVSSPVALSEPPRFKRKFSSVYEALVFGDWGNELRTVFSNSQDENWETIAGRDKYFLGAFAGLADTYALVRLQNNQKLSQELLPKPPGSRGADRKSTRLNSSHIPLSRMPSSA